MRQETRTCVFGYISDSVDKNKNAVPINIDTFNISTQGPEERSFLLKGELSLISRKHKGKYPNRNLKSKDR